MSVVNPELRRLQKLGPARPAMSSNTDLLRDHLHCSQRRTVMRDMDCVSGNSSRCRLCDLHKEASLSLVEMAQWSNSSPSTASYCAKNLEKEAVDTARPMNALLFFAEVVTARAVATVVR